MGKSLSDTDSGLHGLPLFAASPALVEPIVSQVRGGLEKALPDVKQGVDSHENIYNEGDLCIDFCSSSIIEEYSATLQIRVNEKDIYLLKYRFETDTKRTPDGEEKLILRNLVLEEVKKNGNNSCIPKNLQPKLLEILHGILLNYNYNRFLPQNLA